MGFSVGADRTLERLPEDELRSERAAWHREGTRGRLSEGIARLPITLRDGAYALRARLDRRRAVHALSGARSLRYTSQYTHPESDCREIEGYFDLGRGLTYSLWVVSAASMQELADFNWKQGWLAAPYYSDYILVPHKQLDAVVVRQALELWYKERFEFVQGHWSNLEGRTPKLVIDLEFDDGPYSGPVGQ